MKLISIILLAIFCLAAPGAFTGCVGPRTREALVFDTCKTTYNTAREAYKAVVKLHLKRKLSDENRLKADQAWNTFRASFAVAMQASNLDWKDATTGEVETIAYDLIYLLKAL